MFLTTPTHSTVLASLANAFKIPLAQHKSRVQSLPTSKILHNLSRHNSQQTSAFSTTAALAKRKGGFKPDRRITLIRYFLYHPLTPRPLRFSRNRYLRHWTIHRAWQLYQTNLRAEQERELYRQQQAMSTACEELRTACGERGAKLFRVSMNKRGIFTDLFPIEYARLQTDSPAREGWNHGWKRM